jgi:hypothetical protein
MGLACFVFASIKKRPSVTKGQAIREALEPIYGFGEAEIIGAPSFKQCILLVSRMNRTDGFEICRIMFNLLSPWEPLSGKKKALYLDSVFCRLSFFLFCFLLESFLPVGKQGE